MYWESVKIRWIWHFWWCFFPSLIDSDLKVMTVTGHILGPFFNWNSCYLYLLISCLTGLKYKMPPHSICWPSASQHFGNKCRSALACATELKDILRRWVCNTLTHSLPTTPSGEIVPIPEQWLRHILFLIPIKRERWKSGGRITCNTQFILSKCPCGFYFVGKSKNIFQETSCNIIISKVWLRICSSWNTLKLSAILGVFN